MSLTLICPECGHELDCRKRAAVSPSGDGTDYFDYLDEAFCWRHGTQCYTRTGAGQNLTADCIGNLPIINPDN